MKIYYSIDEFQEAKNAVVTTGTFDGVHFGHQKILYRMKEIARFIEGETVIISFFPHPRMILHPEDQSLKLLNSIPEKIRLLEKLKIDHFLIIPFSRDFSNLSSDEFIQKILVNTLNTKKLIIGYDHRFGKDREGGLQSLLKMKSKYHFEVEEIPEQDIDHIAVSSTKIRSALAIGDIKTANLYLHYYYSLEGMVVKGDQIGRTLGYPTANIQIEDRFKLIPGDGVYACKAYLEDKSYEGMLYIGKRPVLKKVVLSIEVNIFNFNEDIYGKPIRLELFEFVRAEMNFPNLDALKEQIALDKIKIQEYFSKNH